MDPKTSITIVISGKGGVGKTFSTATLASLLKSSGTAHDLYSLEIHGRQLPRYHPETIELVLDEVEVSRGDTALDQIFLNAAAHNRPGLIDCD